MTGNGSAPNQHVQVVLPDEHAIGVFADFASVWHTPASFVLDFVSLVQPVTPVPKPDAGGDGDPTSVPVKVTGRVAARVRIPPEQIFRLIEALKEQGEQWLRESGRTVPPDAWAPPGGAIPNPPAGNGGNQ